MPGTETRLDIFTSGETTRIYAGHLKDMSSYYAYYKRPEVGKEGGTLVLNLEPPCATKYTSPTLEDWTEIMKHLACQKRKLNLLAIAFSLCDMAVSLFLDILTRDQIEDIIKWVDKIEIHSGSVTCENLLKWLFNWSSSDWSVRGHGNGAEIINKHGESVVIKLLSTMVLGSVSEENRTKLVEDIRLLHNPFWEPFLE